MASQTSYVRSSELVQLEAGTRRAVYHRRLGGLCLLDKAAFAVLSEFGVPTQLDCSLMERRPTTRREELLQQLILREFLVRLEPLPAAHDNPLHPIRVVQLIMINQCNFGCKYCFLGQQGADTKGKDSTFDLVRIQELRSTNQDIRVNLDDSIFASEERFRSQYDRENRVMTPEAAVSHTNRALDIAKQTGAHEVMLQFFGGEPLMNWKACRAVLESVGSVAHNGLQIRYSMVTNGSLLNHEIASVLASHRVAVCVSFDSGDSSQRPLKNGDESASVVKKGLAVLREHGVYVAINSALTSTTFDEFTPAIVDVASEYGAKEIGVVVDFDPTFYRQFSPTHIVDKLFAVIEAGNKKGIAVTGYWHQIFQMIANFNAVTTRGFKNCSAKGAQLSIEPDGSVFSCKAGSGYFGNIQENIALLDSATYHAHTAMRYDNPEICRGCPIEHFCAGLCLGPIEKQFGRVDAIETSACDFYRGITKRLIELAPPTTVSTFDL